MEILAVRNLSFTYALSDVESLSDVSFSLEDGDFALISGPTGCGKSTLLKLLKRELTPSGEISGSIVYKGTAMEALSPKASAKEIGFVMQRPEQQLVTDKVWHELAFGLENLGLPRAEIRKRVAEAACWFGIEALFDRDTDSLSGGQKQLLNLAAVTAMRPGLLILDEPTAQLDPISAEQFLTTVSKLNREQGVTVILVEHRLDQSLPLANRMLVMNEGKILRQGDPSELCGALGDIPSVLESMPAPVRLYHGINASGSCPITAVEGRSMLKRHLLSYKSEGFFRSNPGSDFHDNKLKDHAEDCVLSLENVFFRYARELPDILRGTNLSISKGEILCVMGGNGSGKTTLLSVIAGLQRPYSGKLRIFGKPIGDYKGRELYESCLSMLPQDVQSLFVKSTVKEELDCVGFKPEMLPYDLSRLMLRHPYDLSGGEQQLVALAKVLATKPRLILLDEPTKGLDTHYIALLTGIIQSLRDDGISFLIVSHDSDFAAAVADRCALFFRGEIVSDDTPRAFFCENSYYTTVAAKLSRDILPDCISVSDILHQLPGPGEVAP